MYDVQTLGHGNVACTIRHSFDENIITKISTLTFYVTDSDRHHAHGVGGAKGAKGVDDRYNGG